MSHKVPPRAPQAETGSLVGSQQHQAGGHGGGGRLITPHTQPQPSRRMKSLCRRCVLRDRSLEVSLPGGHQRSPLKAQTDRASTTTSCSLQTQVLDEKFTQAGIPPQKSSPVSATSRLGSPRQEDKAKGPLTTLPGQQHRDEPTPPGWHRRWQYFSLCVIGKNTTPRGCLSPRGVAATLQRGWVTLPQSSQH